jgi:hypothetical protein
MDNAPESDIEVMRRRAGLAKDTMSPKAELKRALQNIGTAIDEAKYAIQRHKDPSNWLVGIEKQLNEALYAAHQLQNPPGQE